MAIIRVKRGTATPTTSNLSNIGELAYNYITNELYARSSSSVEKIGGELERVYHYEGSAAVHSFNYAFNKDYIYKVHIISSTTTSTGDTSTSTLNYLTSSSTYFSGGYINVMFNDAYSGTTKTSSVNTSNFIINDAYSNSTTPRYAVTKVIDFEISPTFESSVNSTYQWVSQGYSICTASDQSNAPITYTQFAHTIDGSIYGLRICLEEWDGIS